MRESGTDGSGKGLLGGLAAVVALIGASVARFGDDLGMVMATGARSLDDVAATGAVMDDVGRVGVVGAALDDASLAARIGTAEDGEQLVRLLGEVGLEVADLASAVASPSDPEPVLPGAPAPARDPIAEGLQALDRARASGPPVLAYRRPEPGPGPQYVLVSSVQSSLGVLAECAARGQWCLVEQVDSEEPAVYAARFQAQQRWWEQAHPSDAEWVAALGRALPEGADAVWLEVSSERVVLARPKAPEINK